MRNIIKDITAQIRAVLSRNTWQQILLLCMVSSVCFPFPITCVVLLSGLVVLYCSKKTRGQIRLVRWDLLLFGFGALCVVVPLFYKRYISSLAGVGLVLGIAFFILARSMITKILFFDIMKACCLTSSVCFIYAIVQKLVNGTHFRATAGLLNANYYGTICEFIIIFAVFGLIYDRAMSHFYCIVLIINIAGIFLCDCQSAWIAVMAAVFCLLLFSGNKKAAFIFSLAAVILLIVGICTPGILPRLEHIASSYSTRKNIWQTAVMGIKEHPVFGQGAFTYLFSHELYGGYKTYHAHSIYLDPLMCYGVVGVGLMLTYAVHYLRKLYALKHRTVRAVIVAAVASAVVHGVTDNTLLWVQTGIIMLFVLSGCFIKSEDAEKKKILI